MKRLFTITALALFALTSCKKKKCWTCTVSINSYSNSPYGNNTNGTSTTSVCDKTEKEIKDVEKAGSMTTHSSAGNISVTQVQTTTCR